ncbi:uncharacterized protein JCM6883_004843 [Sporobolomyces salmoneus]|uniref:uncharacterized protein n=1 Tax=Sporobolomyces salmoneus TaxID=183962 RepID=UPI0031725C96
MNQHSPNPHLTQPILHVDGLFGSVRDEEIVQVLVDCLPIRLNLERQSDDAPLSGIIEFTSLHNAEKAFATSNHQIFPRNGGSLDFHLSPSPAQVAQGGTSLADDPGPLSVPRSVPRLLKSLPRNFTPGKVFDLCREFGPIYSATLQLAPAYPPGSGPPKFKGQALVTFYEEEDAQKMTAGLHFLEVEGQSIIVATWDSRRAEKGRRSDIGTKSARLSSSSPPPAQTKSQRTSSWANSTALKATSPEFVSLSMSRNVSGASQWSNNTGDTSTHESTDLEKPSLKARGDGLKIDPCNLFVKSLNPSLSSQDLYNIFSPYGKIVSARVMTDPTTSRSKEFGFVSFEEAEQADLARREMDGKLVGIKHITVRLHEPKKIREARLSAGGETAESEVSDVERRLSQLSTSGRQTSEMDESTSPASVSADALSPVVALSERDRLFSAVKALCADNASEVVELIEQLPKKERMMCLFNPDILEQKVQDALLVLEASKEEELKQQEGETTTDGDKPSPDESSKQLDVSSAAAETVPSSIQLLAKLPASEIIRLLPAATPVLQLSTPGPEELESTRQFMEELEGLPVGQIKQKLGEKLFKVVKKAGVKRAPKITIDLLDTEDLGSLSVLLHYPEILKEKAILLSAS